MKKILFVSDNNYLINKIKEIVSNKKNVECEFVRTGENTNSYMACSESVPTINIKSDYLQLIGKYDIIFSIHCMQIFPAELVSNVKCINIHPGYNPYNRGWYPQVFGIINNLPCGATIHEMDPELDHGGIIAQRIVDVSPIDNSRTMYDKILQNEIELFDEYFDIIVLGNYQIKETEVEGNINYKKDFKNLCKLDINEQITIGQFIDRLRALTHPPYRNAYFYTENGEKVYVSIELTLENS